MNIEEIVQHYPTCKVTNFKKGKNTMKKSISIILAVLMLAACIPMFASAATITLSSSNVEIIPPTVTPAEVKYGEGSGGVTSIDAEKYANEIKTAKNSDEFTEKLTAVLKKINGNGRNAHNSATTLAVIYPIFHATANARR